MHTSQIRTHTHTYTHVYGSNMLCASILRMCVLRHAHICTFLYIHMYTYVYRWHKACEQQIHVWQSPMHLTTRRAQNFLSCVSDAKWTLLAFSPHPSLCVTHHTQRVSESERAVLTLFLKTAHGLFVYWTQPFRKISERLQNRSPNLQKTWVFPYMAHFRG